jgi:hypothetical protein
VCPVVDRPERRLLGPHRGVHPRRSAPDKCAPCRTPVKLRRRFVRTIRLMLTAELDSQLDTDRRQIIMDDHLSWSKMVARGGIEPPTFRFSGVRTIVHRRPSTSATCTATLNLNTNERRRTYTDETKDETTIPPRLANVTLGPDRGRRRSLLFRSHKRGLTTTCQSSRM